MARFVTGGDGFIGYNFVRRALQKNDRVIGNNAG